MPAKKPSNEQEYLKWLKERHGVEITTKTKTYYDSVTSAIVRAYESSDFWQSLPQALREIDSEYYIQTKGYNLFTTEVVPKLESKPFKSFLSKTFRKNCLNNRNWPEAPNDGWVLPVNWFSRINDIVRTLLVVRFLDGVEFLATALESMLDERGMPNNRFMEAREEGYYAAHIYTHKEIEIPRADWDTEKVEVSLELQITTQLQEVIRKLLHRYYEQRRESSQRSTVKWQWKYGSDEFVANYLGHILHYVEGMIMDVRQRQQEGS